MAHNRGVHATLARMAVALELEVRAWRAWLRRLRDMVEVLGVGRASWPWGLRACAKTEAEAAVEDEILEVVSGIQATLERLDGLVESVNHALAEMKRLLPETSLGGIIE